MTLDFFRDWIDRSFRDEVPVRMDFHADVEEGRRAAGLAPPIAP